MASEPHVALRHVHMAFDEREVFRDLSCAFPRGKISVILGGSGSGKSTILRLIGGLVQPIAGNILVDGEDVTQLSERELNPVRAKLGMMFQGGALLDAMTVLENLALPLREHADLDEQAIASAVHERLAAVGLTDVDDLLPGQLSGGMMRRVALARALVMKPVIVLCDEPFSGLDPVSVRLIETLLARVNRTLGMTLVIVSHHIASTMRLAHHILLLLPDDAVEGSPAELRRSTDPEVRAFLDEGPEEPTAAPPAA